MRSKPTEVSTSLRTTDLHTVMGGVSIPWLVKVFRMGRGKIEEALRDCPVLRVHANGGAIYDLPTAASYLVAPVTNVDAHLRRLKPADLPEHLKSAYWDAKTKEAKFRVMAGDLWPTAAILDVFGETFKTIKKTTLLWTDTIDESKGMTNEQRTMLTGLVDRLMAELHLALIEQSNSSMSGSWLKEFEDGASET